MRQFMILTLSACLAACAVPVLGGEKDGKKPEAVPDKTVKRDKFDLDGDGKLNEEELEAARVWKAAYAESVQKKLLAKFDFDKDGKLSEAELAAVKAAEAEQAAAPKPKKEIMAQPMKDGNGKLKEAPKFEKDGAAVPEKIKFAEKQPLKDGGKFDKGGEAPVIDEQLVTKLKALFDADGDGKLNDKESAAAKAAMGKLLGGEGKNKPEKIKVPIVVDDPF